MKLPWAEPPQPAGCTLGRAGVARSAPVAQQIHVEFQRCIGRRQGNHLVMQLLKRRARPEQTEARSDS